MGLSKRLIVKKLIRIIYLEYLKCACYNYTNMSKNIILRLKS